MDWEKLSKDALEKSKQLAEVGTEKFDEWKNDPKRIAEVEKRKEKMKNKAGLFYQGVYCPKCRSTNVEFMHNKRKGFSSGKAIGGAILTGGIGTLAGFAGKDGKKNKWHCLDCGKTFISKK